MVVAFEVLDENEYCCWSREQHKPCRWRDNKKL